VINEPPLKERIKNLREVANVDTPDNRHMAWCVLGSHLDLIERLCLPWECSNCGHDSYCEQISGKQSNYYCEKCGEGLSE
jgi:hypothetical protein